MVESLHIIAIVITETMKPSRLQGTVQLQVMFNIGQSTYLYAMRFQYIDKLMPPTSRFGEGNRAGKKQGVIQKLQIFFERFFGIG